MKKSTLAFVFLFSVSVLAFLGPREEAEGQVKKKPDKLPMPVTGTPSGRVIPLPTTAPQFKKNSAIDLHLFDDLKNLDPCLHLGEIPHQPLAEGDLHLFHTVATVNVPPRVDLAFDESGTGGCHPQFDLTLRGDLDRLNFQELSAGAFLGWSRSGATVPLVVTDESGRIVTDEFLAVQRGQVQLCRSVIPAMFTCEQSVIRQDCLGYLMERYPMQKSTL